MQRPLRDDQIVALAESGVIARESMTGPSAWTCPHKRLSL
jgi:hypothetical protein